MTINIESLGSVRAQLGECPIWDVGNRQLCFMDCRGGYIYRLDPATGQIIQAYRVPAPAGSFALNVDGRFLVALKEEMVLFDPVSGEIECIARIDDTHSNLRLNDGEAMPDGSFVVGTMHVPREEGQYPLGGLYRLAPDGSFEQQDKGFGVTNGPCVSPLNGRLYVSDSSVQTIYSYEITPLGKLTDQRIFINTGKYGSGPDGCCFDRLGGLWMALVREGAIARFEADGTLTHKIKMPVSHPSSLCFGGDNLDELFVTSISDSGRLRADGPFDGAVLRIRGIGIQGFAPAKTRIGMSV
ncbi:senescence marker protein-30 (SMP-30) (regucalcin) (RC) [Advenella faeciporci]|uniref:Senescence marker protein-30 (SMP-30) (Regucalcin) (RC) n=1 Tax=Advenella faeciporci TaxID=797535 RepID=A0A918JJF4_9BURK|nr:SMP-30/gluconolactonase/LRE family protein [Advenella faeciporci]GGW83331.1 senescence marker protein-30 (SMP-30) (regucalcin) (RC) [Advenella faeciporci]